MGDEIKIQAQNSKVFVTIGKNGQITIHNKSSDKETASLLQNLFDAIAKTDGGKNDKRIDTAEGRKLCQQLASIFAADGDTTASNEELNLFFNSDRTDLLTNWKDEIKSQLKTLAPEIYKSYYPEEAAEVADQTKSTTLTQENAGDPTGGGRADVVKTQKPAGFAEKVSQIAEGIDIEEVTTENEYVIEKGKTLYNIAKELLIDMGEDNPSPKNIMKMIALIQKLNSDKIKNIDVIQAGWKIKVPTKVPDGFIDGHDGEGVREATGGGAIVADGAGSGSSVRARSVKINSSLPLTELSIWPENTDYSDTIEDGDFKYWEFYTKGNSDEVVCYNTEVKIGTEENLDIFAPSLAEVKQMKADIDAELAKIKGADANEEPEAAEARKADNMAAIAKIAELSHYSKYVLLGLLKTYFQDESYVDTTSEAYDTFMTKILGTRDYNIISSLPIKDAADPDDGRCNFKGSEENFRNLVTVYQELLAKEADVVKLTEDETKLKEYLAKLSGELKLITDFGEDEDAAPVLGMFFNEEGEILYLGQAGIYNDIGLKNISASSEASIKAFQEDYKAALKAVEDAEADKKDAVKAEKFKELYKKYANTTDKELALSVLTSGLAKYAAPEDIQAAINSHDAEFLDYLAGGVNKNKYTLDNDTLKVFAERAKELYKSADPELFMNLLNIRTLLTTKTGFDSEKSGIDYVNDIINSYFTVTTDAEGIKTYAFKPSRKMTPEEAERMVEVIVQLDYDSTAKTWKDTGRIQAILDTLTSEDVGEDKLCRVINDVLWKKLSIRDDSTMTMFREMYGKFVKNLGSDVTDDEIVKFMYPGYYYAIPFDAIIESYSDRNNVMNRLIGEFNPRWSVISDDNKAKFLGMVKQDDDTYKFDKSKLLEGITISDVMEALPLNDDNGLDEYWKPYMDAMFDAIDFTKGDDSPLMFLDKNLYSIERLKHLSTEQKDKLIKGLEKNPNLVQATLFQDSNVLKEVFDNTELERIYNAVGKGNKARMVKDGVMGDGMVVVKQGDRFDNILKDYLKNNLEKFPRLQKAVQDNPNTWTPERIDEALNDYCQDFRSRIMTELHIDPLKMKENDIIDLRNIDWSKYQPGWFDWQSY